MVGRKLLPVLLLPLLAACPQQNTVMGDVPLGEYDVQATKTSDDCVIGGAVPDGDFAFRARLSGDSRTGKVYLVVSVPPGYAEQPAVSGQIEGGSLVFSGKNATPLPVCNCSPLVSERFAFTPLTSSDGGVDGGVGDAGPGDGGVVDAGSSDGGAGDAGSGDAGAGDAGPGLGELPPLAEIVGLGGSLDYTVEAAAACEAYNADAGTGCVLPCEIHYLLAGDSLTGTP